MSIDFSISLKTHHNQLPITSDFLTDCSLTFPSCCLVLVDNTLFFWKVEAIMSVIRNTITKPKKLLLFAVALTTIAQVLVSNKILRKFAGLDTSPTRKSALEDIATNATNGLNDTSPFAHAKQYGIASATSGKVFLGERIRAYEGEKQFAGNGARGTIPRHVKSNDGISCTKWNVVTTIFEPTEAVKRASNVKGWCTVIVADTKTPLDYMEKLRNSSSNDENIVNQNGDFIVFLSVKDQLEWIEGDRKSAVGKFLEALPFRHFARKNIGFLYAVAHGARTIFDFDDDNLLPLSSLSPSNETTVLPALHDTDVLSHAAMVVTGPKAFNHHHLMGATVEGSTWPRGFPLSQIQNNATWGTIAIDMDDYRNISIANEVGVLQFVANQNPDVDAIHRLVQGENNMQTGAPITFLRHAKHMATDGEQQAKNYYDKTKSISTMGALVVPSHSFVPYNAQASIHTYKAMFALLLPMTVPGRVSDIWRSYFSQRIFRDVEISSPNGNYGEGLKIVILPPDIEHERNEHSLLADMEAEEDLYYKTEALLEFLNQWQPKNYEEADIPSLMEELWIDLYERDYVQLEDINVLQLWLSALVEVGYEFPKRPPESHRRIKDVVLMEQFNFPTLWAENEQGDDENKKSFIFLYQKWRQKFDTVVLRGPFSEELANEFRTKQEIDMSSTRSSMKQDRGFTSPMDNLLSTLKQYKDVPGVNGVLYIHDDMLVNTTNIFFGNGNEKNGMDRLHTIFATAEVGNVTGNAYRIHIASNDDNGNKPSLYYSTLDGIRRKEIREMVKKLNEWPWRPMCMKQFSKIAWHCFKNPQNAICKQLIEHDDITNGDADDPFLLVAAQHQSDFLYIPTPLADQYEAIAQLLVSYDVFLECGIPKIIDYLLGMPSSSRGKGENNNSTTSPTDARLSNTKLCTNWERRWRGKPEMITICAKDRENSGAPLKNFYSAIHPIKLSKFGYKRWDRVFDWATMGSTFFDTNHWA